MTRWGGFDQDELLAVCNKHVTAAVTKTQPNWTLGIVKMTSTHWMWNYYLIIYKQTITWYYHICCKLVHKIINFRSWCALNFSSKWLIIYVCALSYRVLKKKKTIGIWFSDRHVYSKPSHDVKNYIHRADISWLKLFDSTIQIFLKLTKWYIIPSIKIHAWSYLGPNCL